MKKAIANAMLSLMAVSLVVSASEQRKDITKPMTQNEVVGTNLLLVSDIIYPKIPQILKQQEQETVNKSKKRKKQSKEDKAKLEFEKHMDKKKDSKDKEKWFKKYKTLLDKYKEVLDVPDTIYDTFNKEELQLLFSVVQAEIGDGYTFEQKCNVVSVIFNRLNHERFPNTLSEILTRDQFATISNGRYKEVKVSDTTKLACEYAYEIEDTSKGCLFFDSNKALRYKFVWNDDAHNFYTYHKQ